MSAGEVAFVTAGLQTVRPGSGSKQLQLQRHPEVHQAPLHASLASRCSGAALGGALVAYKRQRSKRSSRQAFGKFMSQLFPWTDDKKEKEKQDSSSSSPPISTTLAWKQLTDMEELGKGSFEKALKVNLDDSIYGSFAEIGAGQEVSRTFLTAGAAAGTVARSLSAYDMQLSDVTYGKASRYVTQERLQQMLQTEYDTLEASIREVKGPTTRFFSFATTLAAKAYMSNRECDGWMGMQFQHEAGAAPSRVQLHVRMCDDTAQLQGEAIGKLGTNLVYLCNKAKDPVVIASFLLDAIEENRLEVDFLQFDGPGFPEETVDYRLLAMKMVEFKVAPSVLLVYDDNAKSYVHAVPNNAFYKRPVVVQRSRFKPVTFAHQEVIEAAAKKLKSELPSDSKEVLQILDFQIDDIVRPANLLGTEGRLRRTKAAVEADKDKDGLLSVDALGDVFATKMDKAEAKQLAKELDVKGQGKVTIDQVLGWTNSVNNVEFLDRFRMLESLKLPVLVSGVGSDAELSSYLARYTTQPIVLAVGGGNYDIGRGIFNEKVYSNYKGGMLEAFGKLFSGNVRIFQYPNIGADGEVSNDVEIPGSKADLHRYLVGEKQIVAIETEFMDSSAASQDSNESYRGQSEDVVKLMKQGSSDWENYVPEEAGSIIKKSRWFQRYTDEGPSSQEVIYKVFEVLDEVGA